jgi:hypothetical protein
LFSETNCSGKHPPTTSTLPFNRNVVVNDSRAAADFDKLVPSFGVLKQGGCSLFYLFDPFTLSRRRLQPSFAVD